MGIKEGMSRLADSDRRPPASEAQDYDRRFEHNGGNWSKFGWCAFPLPAYCMRSGHLDAKAIVVFAAILVDSAHHDAVRTGLKSGRKTRGPNIGARLHFSPGLLGCLVFGKFLSDKPIRSRFAPPKAGAEPEEALSPGLAIASFFLPGADVAVETRAVRLAHRLNGVARLQVPAGFK